ILGGALLLSACCLALIGNCVRLHYAALRQGGELARLRQDPLLKKYPSAPAPPEQLDLETARALGEKQGLTFVSSRGGDNEMELLFTGGYTVFLDYLRALSAEPSGEISQITIGQEQKIIIKGEQYAK
ncbi:hypothetical protein NO2_1572, partial [Candidatus Termititenax persephonae]